MRGNFRLFTWLVFSLCCISTSVFALEIDIQTGDYLGKWDIDTSNQFYTGPATVDLSPGLHTLRAGRTAFFSFTVTNSGEVTLGPEFDNISAIGGQSTLQLLTIPVTVNPQQYTGMWGIDFIRNSASGADIVHLVPSERNNFGNSIGAEYLVSIGIGTTSVLMALRGDGSMTFRSGGSGGTTDMAYELNGVLNFRNTTVSVVDTGAGTTPWRIRQVYPPNNSSYAYGNATLTLVPGAQYGFEGSFPTQLFNVAYPCAVSPSTHEIGGTTFEITCDSLDTDQDGVPDNSDNCIHIANPQQIDLDFDGLGDACDSDDDNDTIPDTEDNCPQDPNTDQADSDLDGVGDLCDGDEDGDGVENELDQCPFTAANVSVDTQGCSGNQSIAKRCKREDFIQHGQYVSCVATAANDAANQGLIPSNKKHSYIKEAAKK